MKDKIRMHDLHWSLKIVAYKVYIELCILSAMLIVGLVGFWLYGS